MRVTEEFYAEKWKRFVNYLVDYLIKLGIGYLTGLAIGYLYIYFNVAWPYDMLMNTGMIGQLLLGYLISIMYYTFFEMIFIRTPSKFITGTKVVDEFGERPSAKAIILRSLCRIIPFEPFSFFSNDGRGWHDTLTKTYVIDVKKFKEGTHLYNEFNEIGAYKENM